MSTAFSFDGKSRRVEGNGEWAVPVRAPRRRSRVARLGSLVLATAAAPGTRDVGVCGARTGAAHSPFPALNCHRRFAISRAPCHKVTLIYQQVYPPSTTTTLPVIRLAASDARKCTTDAISSTVPNRAIGVPAIHAAYMSGFDFTNSFSGVLM